MPAHRGRTRRYARCAHAGRIIPCVVFGCCCYAAYFSRGFGFCCFCALLQSGEHPLALAPAISSHFIAIANSFYVSVRLLQSLKKWRLRKPLPGFLSLLSAAQACFCCAARQATASRLSAARATTLTERFELLFIPFRFHLAFRSPPQLTVGSQSQALGQG